MTGTWRACARLTLRPSGKEYVAVISTPRRGPIGGTVRPVTTDLTPASRPTDHPTAHPPTGSEVYPTGPGVYSLSHPNRISNKFFGCPWKGKFAVHTIVWITNQNDLAEFYELE